MSSRDIKANAMAREYEAKFVTLLFSVMPISMGVSVITSAPVNLTLPFWGSTIQKGAKMAIDVLQGEILENTAQVYPTIEALQHDYGHDEDKDFSLDMGIALGTKAMLKMNPRLPDFKPKDECIDSYGKAIKKLLVTAANKTKDSIPKWLNRKNIDNFGFGDPLTVGVRADWARWDFNVHTAHNVDNHCKANGSMKSALQMQSSFRQGFTPFVNLFFWRADTSMIGKVEKGDDAAAGLFKTWKTEKYCYGMNDSSAGFEEMKNVTEAGVMGKCLGGGLGDEPEKRMVGDVDVGRLASRMWVEEMAMASNDTARMLASTLRVNSTEMGLSEGTDVEYVVDPEEA